MCEAMVLSVNIWKNSPTKSPDLGLFFVEVM